MGSIKIVSKKSEISLIGSRVIIFYPYTGSRDEAGEKQGGRDRKQEVGTIYHNHNPISILVKYFSSNAAPPKVSITFPNGTTY